MDDKMAEIMARWVHDSSEEELLDMRGKIMSKLLDLGVDADDLLIMNSISSELMMRAIIKKYT